MSLPETPSARESTPDGVTASTATRLREPVSRDREPWTRKRAHRSLEDLADPVSQRAHSPHRLTGTKEDARKAERRSDLSTETEAQSRPRLMEALALTNRRTTVLRFRLVLSCGREAIGCLTNGCSTPVRFDRGCMGPGATDGWQSNTVKPGRHGPVRAPNPWLRMPHLSSPRPFQRDPLASPDTPITMVARPPRRSA